MAVKERGEIDFVVGEKTYLLVLNHRQLEEVDDYFVEKGSSISAYFEDMLKLFALQAPGSAPAEIASHLKALRVKDLGFLLRKGLEGGKQKVTDDEWEAMWHLGTYVIFFVLLGLLTVTLTGPQKKDETPPMVTPVPDAPDSPGDAILKSA